MITIKGYHGNLPLTMVAKMNKIAKPLIPAYTWEYNGTLDDFAKAWNRPFIYYPDCLLYVTQHTSWGAY